MDILVFHYDQDGTRAFFVQFNSPRAQAWMRKNEYYKDLPPDSPIIVGQSEYSELQDSLLRTGLTIMEESGGMH